MKGKRMYSPYRPYPQVTASQVMLRSHPVLEVGLEEANPMT